MLTIRIVFRECFHGGNKLNLSSFLEYFFFLIISIKYYASVSRIRLLVWTQDCSCMLQIADFNMYVCSIPVSLMSYNKKHLTFGGDVIQNDLSSALPQDKV